MAFIQLIEITSSRVSEIEALTAQWRAQTEGQRTAMRATLTQDRDRPGGYIQIVEFGSYEDAMANSRLPATTAFRGTAGGAVRRAAGLPEPRRDQR
jgi:hypothetical protein